MSEQIETIVEEPKVSEEDLSVINKDLTELGHVEVTKETTSELTPEEEEDRREEALHQDKSPEEREAIRERRRLERQEKKQRLREKEDSYKREIEALRRELQEVNNWKNTVETRNVRSGVAQIDKAISDANDALQLARQAMAQATQEQNGEALVDAQELYYAARKRAEELSRVKNTISQRMSQRPAPKVDPMVVENANSWVSKNSWYDPNGRDQDSRIVQTIDRSLAEAGLDPRFPEYWEKLDDTVKKYLPHRYSVANTQTQGYTAQNQGNLKPPTEGGGGAVRNSSGYRLSADRVRAIKEAGAWDDPKLRKEMIQSYIDYDKQQSQR